MSSDESGADLMASFKMGGQKVASPRRKRASFSPAMLFSESSGDEGIAPSEQAPSIAKNVTRRAIAIRPRPVRNREEYKYYEPKIYVERILREFTNRKGLVKLEIRLDNGERREVAVDELKNLEGGSIALQNFDQDQILSDNYNSSSDTVEPDMRLRQKPRRAKDDKFVDISTIDFSEDELDANSRKPLQRRLQLLSRRNTDSSRSRTRSRRGDPIEISDSSESSDEGRAARRRKRNVKVQEPTRRSGRTHADMRDYDEEEEEEDDEEDDEDEDSSDLDILRSDVLGGHRKRKRRSGAHLVKPGKIQRTGVRQSDRSTRARNNMEEANIDDIYRSDSEPRQAAQPKIVGVREVFQPIPRNDLFRARHVDGCEVCTHGSDLSPLVYCQGCCMSYHKNCLGNRTNRDHLVTKIGNDNFILQCKRCVNIYRRKDETAPDLSMCQDCKLPGAACKPFRARKTPQQEQKERDDNAGEDPVINVSPRLINNPMNVLFRCTNCSRSYHFHHLPPLSQYSMDIVRDDDETADARFAEYSKMWLCKECDDMKAVKVSTLIAWRPSDVETYRPGTSCDMICEDEKQYLIKWEDQSYFRASWHSGAWTWGVTAPTMRKAFYKREDGPKMRTEDAIPEEYLRIDIVLNVKYTSYVEIGSEEIDKARIKEVDKALIKYKGLGYEDAVWEKVPTAEDGDRWLDFVTAYNDWVAGRYIKYPKPGPLRARIDKARGTAFSKLEKTKQPDNLVGGELMKYQIEGLNWIYYQWYSQKNGILADEMGLGKTIQVIAYMATLVQEHTCFPFLIVVPNSTCANWRREIKQWVPSLRVVTYFGSAAAREMAYKYEMYPQNKKELRCHVVVTSYEAATDESSRKVLRGVNWAGLIVDEGQRLKNDKSQLYSALNAIKAPFRLLLTGTPLQNNARELFNLLQFLDDSINAAELEEKYAEMTSENIRELHDQIRPFILRRTKVQVLTFLPPLGQVIVPLSMSVLQKTVYKSILAKNPELLKALFMTQKSLKTQERANLSNILMQLRKCLCHPFVYSREIEERTDVAATSHRNLVEASAKLQLLELLLPKLQERGHRVLIFSQFLDMLNIIEDFLDGMQMTYQRLDGTMGSLEKQKRIDQFNAPDSPLFAFLLSTRAGGVGINLATADTVIILDPDFNPHQDIQAISRAHRIGQKKKVLCFQLMTRASAEEKIVQMGRKKMALDHVVVEQLDAEDMEDKDVESILKHGAAELFKDDNTEHDIRYDEASIDRLLDRSSIENTKTSDDDSAESQFSFARVWANEQGTLADTIDTPEEEAAPDPGVWDKILRERQQAAAAEALSRADALGKGKRARTTVNYNTEEHAPVPDITSPLKTETKRGRRKKRAGSESDTDFQADSEAEDSPAESASEGDAEPEGPGDSLQREKKSTVRNSLYEQNDAGRSKFPAITLPSSAAKPAIPAEDRAPLPAKVTDGNHNGRGHASLHVPANSRSTVHEPNKPTVKPFARAQMPIRTPHDSAYVPWRNEPCFVCRTMHPRGACPLKVAGVEHCGLCGLAHYGHARTCPHIKSETQVREMLEALKRSPEKRELVEMAAKYLRGVKGHLVQTKKRERDKSIMQAQGELPGRAVPHTPVPLPGQAAPHAAANGARHSAPNNHAVRHTHVPPPAVPGSVGSYLTGQKHQNTQQRSRPSTGVHDQQPIEDHVVEGALRGFLGQ